MRDMRFYPEAWPLHTAFVIARGSRTEARVVVVEIEQQDVRGIGECTPYPRYGESEESVMAQLAEMAPAIAQGMTREQLLVQMPAGAARNALDSALWDSRVPPARAEPVASQRRDGPGAYPYGADRQHRHAGSDGLRRA